MKLTKQLTFAFLLIGFSVVGWLIAADVARDRALRVSIPKAVPMYANWGMVDGRGSSTPVGTIGPTVEQQVLRVRLGKDFEAIRVRN